MLVMFSCRKIDALHGPRILAGTVSATSATDAFAWITRHLAEMAYVGEWEVKMAAGRRKFGGGVVRVESVIADRASAGKKGKAPNHLTHYFHKKTFAIPDCS